MRNSLNNIVIIFVVTECFKVVKFKCRIGFANDFIKIKSVVIFPAVFSNDLYVHTNGNIIWVTFVLQKIEPTGKKYYRFPKNLVCSLFSLASGLLLEFIYRLRFYKG